MALRYDEIADLIKIIDASACEELVLETADLKLVIRRGSVSSDPKSATRPIEPTTPQRAQAPTPAPVLGKPAAPQIASGAMIRAPMVGVFYRSPSPDTPPFVDSGTVVAPGDPLCIIEVMKLFTTIYAETAGRIVQVCAADAELVEYDRVLFVLEDSS